MVGVDWRYSATHVKDGENYYGTIRYHPGMRRSYQQLW
jgi:hypothetical protein